MGKMSYTDSARRPGLGGIRPYSPASPWHSGCSVTCNLHERMTMLDTIAPRPSSVDRRDATARYALVQRVYGEFHEMPCMRLTAPQARLLFGLRPDVSERILAGLVRQGLLSCDGERYRFNDSRGWPVHNETGQALPRSFQGVLTGSPRDPRPPARPERRRTTTVVPPAGRQSMDSCPCALPPGVSPSPGTPAIWS